MLNMSFTVWQMKSAKLAFELGEMSDDPKAESNPPSIDGLWDYQRTGSGSVTDVDTINIKHFKYSREKLLAEE